MRSEKFVVDYGAPASKTFSEQQFIHKISPSAVSIRSGWKRRGTSFHRLFLLEEWNALERFKINMKSIYYKVLKALAEVAALASPFRFDGIRP
jgi:hypothetical protein